MQDRFKFRAWDNRTKVMRGTNNRDFFTIRCDGLLSSSDSDHYILMQCTGLKDNNGKLIYEGDIIEWQDCSIGKIIREVKFGCIDSGDRYGFMIENYFGGERPYLLPNYVAKESKIIGNIYENPELLNEAKNE